MSGYSYEEKLAFDCANFHCDLLIHNERKKIDVNASQLAWDIFKDIAFIELKRLRSEKLIKKHEEYRESWNLVAQRLTFDHDTGNLYYHDGNNSSVIVSKAEK